MSNVNVRGSKSGGRACDLCGEIWADRIQPGGGEVTVYNVVRLVIAPAEGPGAQNIDYPPTIDVCRLCVTRPISDLIPELETAVMGAGE